MQLSHVRLCIPVHLDLKKMTKISKWPQFGPQLPERPSLSFALQLNELHLTHLQGNSPLMSAFAPALPVLPSAQQIPSSLALPDLNVETNRWVKTAGQAAAESLAAGLSSYSSFFFSLWEEGIIITGVRKHMLCFGLLSWYCMVCLHF